MRGCTTSQCLVFKDNSWEPQECDQDFELKSNYYLSGLSESYQSCDSSHTSYSPARFDQRSHWGVGTVIWYHWDGVSNINLLLVLVADYNL